jgi:hypothetical protein
MKHLSLGRIFISCVLSKAAGFEVVVSVKEVFLKRGKKEWAVGKGEMAVPFLFSSSYLSLSYLSSSYSCSVF